MNYRFWVIGLSIVVVNGRRVAAKGRYLDRHVRKQRQARERAVELLHVSAIENADVGVLSSDAPKMTPNPGPL
jgi:hypothetical protein